MTIFPSSLAKENLSEIINRVVYGKERIFIKAHKKCVAMISMEELEYFGKLQEQEEMRKEKKEKK